MIIIDGRQTEMNLDNFSNLEEILVQANTRCNDDQRIVTDVLLNDNLFSEIYPHQAEDIERAEIRKVEVRSVPFAEMALDISDELFKVTRLMSNGSREVAELFHRGDDAEALEMFLNLLDVTRDFMSMVGVLRSEFVNVNDPAFVDHVEKLSELLGEMSEVLATEDWILLADLLEFEFTPVCEAWNNILRTMRDGINASLNKVQ